MNVEVLGADNIYYGASMSTIFAKTRAIPSGKILKATPARRAVPRVNQWKGIATPKVAPVIASYLNRFGDDNEMMGLDFGKIGKGILNIGKTIVNVVKSPGGKVVTSAALTAVAGRLTPTQKAQVASAQEIAGINPQVITGGGVNEIQAPVAPDNGVMKNLPIIIGGAGLLIVFAMVALKKS
jgi:hypothetical protein